MNDLDRLRINPLIHRLVCSASGREVDHGGFARPIGLCGCCPPPGKPVVVEYDLERATLGRAERALGMWSFADLLPVGGLPPSFAADVGLTPMVELHRWGRELGITEFA